MYQTREIVQEIKRFIKRRRKLLIFTPIFFGMLSVGALYIIEPQYESSTTLMVQNEETLNPLNLYEMAGNEGSEDLLKSLNDIVYSRSTVEKLIDSLNLDHRIQLESEKQKLVNKVQENITTVSRGSGSFKIIYTDTDPVRARDGVELLAAHFIQTRSRMENRRNSEAVAFFQTKIDELEKIIDTQHQQIVNEKTERLKKPPVDQTTFQTKLQNIDSQLDELEWKIIREESKLDNLNDFLNHQTFTVQPLYKLPLDDIPLGMRLSDLISEYEQLKQQFADSSPQLQSLQRRLIDVAKRISSATEQILSSLKVQRRDLSLRRASVINDMEESFMASQQNSSQESDLNIYQELYNDMKKKLEQARMNRDMEDKAEEQFVVIEPAYIPQTPVSPDRKLIIGVGIILGIIFGGIFAAIAEALDTTLRSDEDYDKPIIAYLTDGSAKIKK